jgi:uncharacterized delta-60 repeat protein
MSQRCSFPNSRRARPALEQLESRLAFAAGALDPTFAGGSASVGFDLGGGKSDLARAVAVQSDGKIVVVGTAQVDATNHDFAIARYHRNGTLDTSFDTDGKKTISFNLGGSNEDSAMAVAIDSQGRLVIAGYASTTSNGFDFAVCRLLANGTLDNTFDTDGKTTVSFDLGGSKDDQCFALALGGDKIILAGKATQPTGSDLAFVRLTSTGAPDSTFDGDGKKLVGIGAASTIDEVRAIAVQPDGKIVAGGKTNAANDDDFAICRLNVNGSIDLDFDVDGLQIIVFDLGGNKADVCNSLAIQPDGKIVLAGSGATGVGDDFVVCRLLTNGSPDPAFDLDGRTTIAFNRGGTHNDQAHAVTVQQDGKIVVTGLSDNGFNLDIAVCRLTAAGTLDPFFAGTGKAWFAIDKGGSKHDQGYAIANSPHGILVAGSVATTSAGDDFAVLRLRPDPWVVVSADQGGPPTVKIFTPSGSLWRQFNAYGASFRGGVRVAVGDVTGDGVPDVLTSPGQGGSPIVNVFDGVTGGLVKQIQVYGLSFTLGVNLALGDVMGDGKFELVVAPDVGGAPFVNIFDPNTGTLLRQLLVYGPTFTNGVRVTTGDLIAGGKREVLVAPQTGGAPFVNIFNAVTGSRVLQIQAFGLSFTLGLHLATGNSDGTGADEVVVGPGVGGTPTANIFNNAGVRIKQVACFSPTLPFGVRVATLDVDGDGMDDLLAGSGAGGTPTLKIKDGDTSADVVVFDAFEAAMNAGLFVTGLTR